MKKYLLIIACLFSLHAFSQATTRDVVYLKNGSVIKGKITEMNPSENLKIETSDGSLFVYKMSEILKMEKEESTGSKMNTNKTESSVNIKILSNYFNSYFSRNRKAIKFIDVSKKNGVRKEVYGQKIYKIEYELLLEPLQDIFISEMMSVNTSKFSRDFSYMTKQPRGWDSYMNSDTKKISKGQRIIANGTITLEETDNGWRVSNFSNRNYKTVSSSYVTKNMINQQKEKVESYKKAGDWKKEDITELQLTPFYLEAKNIPMFESSINKVDVKKLPKRCLDCRNNNIMAIETTIKNALLETKRYHITANNLFSNSPNTSKLRFFISRISTTHKGVNNQGKDKGFTCKITYVLLLRANFTSPQELKVKDSESKTASSSSWYFYSSKSSAFKGALSQLKSQVKKMILKYEPLALTVKTIELDKKGNPEFVIFETTNNLFDAKKIEFIVLEKSSLKMNNGKFSISNKLGEVTYKKSDYPNEVKCKIKKSKMKKMLKKYIGKELELTGVSN